MKKINIAHSQPHSMLDTSVPTIGGLAMFLIIFDCIIKRLSRRVHLVAAPVNKLRKKVFLLTLKRILGFRDYLSLNVESRFATIVLIYI